MTTPKSLKIGIFGGSFNPPTTAHGALTQYAYERLGVDQIWWLVAPHNPLKDKKDLAPFADRLAMAEIVARQYAPWLKISDLEQHFGTQQTADTLDRIMEKYPEHQFVWLMGTDNLTHFHSWDRWDEMARKVPIYIFARPGEIETALNSPASIAMGAPVRVTPDVSQLKSGQWMLLSNPEMNVAATKIRQAIVSGYKPDHILPDVLTYIQDNGLYHRQD
ncbi:MAG TPA: nicotinate (nicotinamide) nucleotide adenylyltransferase [Alphaproteobacteria bacterium]